MALKTEEIEDIAHPGSRGRVAITGVCIARDERRLETEEVKDVECALSGGGVAVGVAVGCEIESVQAVLSDGVKRTIGNSRARSCAAIDIEHELRV